MTRRENGWFQIYYPCYGKTFGWWRGIYEWYVLGDEGAWHLYSPLDHEKLLSRWELTN